MFSKISRYYRVPDVTAPDAQGRLLAAKDVRRTPQVEGTFRHTVEAGDRLDQLAYKYYRQPLKWWRICDANPQFLSPLALLDQDAIVTLRIPLDIAGTPPWNNLFQKLESLIGVEDVLVQEDIEEISKQQVVNGQTIDVFVEKLTRAVLVTYNRQLLDPETVAASIEAAGFTAGQPAEVGQLGQEIVVPPDGSG